MANNYYARSKTFTAGTKAKGSDVVSELDSVLAGFDKLPTPAQLDSGNSNFVAAGGTSNALTITSPNNVITTYTGADGLAYSVKATATSIAGAVTIDVDGVGAVALVTDAGETPSLGSLTLNGIYLFVYNETVGKFIFSDYKSSVLSAAAAAASAAAAATSETNAATSETNAEAAYDNFDDRWLGDKASDPTLDNDGNALLTGAAYFNTVVDKLKLYDGANWTTIQDGITDIVSDTTPQLGGDLDLNGHEITGLSGDGEKDFVASGAISALDSVSLQSDGTVSISAIPSEAGTPVVFESADAQGTAIAYDSTNNRIVIAYTDAGNSSFGTAIVGTISGTTISFGTPVVFESASVNYCSATFDSANNKVVIAYRDNGNSNFGAAIVGTVSGTSISFGTAVVFLSSLSNYTSIEFEAASSKVVVACSDASDSSHGKAIVGTVSGTSISFGTAVTFEAASITYTAIAYDSTNNKVVIAYRDNGNSTYGTAIVGTVSGTSISFGTAVVFNAAVTGELDTAYSATDNKITIAYRDGGNSNYGTMSFGTVSGTSIVFVDPIVFESAASADLSAAYDSTSGHVVVSYSDEGNSNYGTASVVDVTSFDTHDVIGIATAAISDTATGVIVTTGGISAGHTGLTINTDYYVNSDGDIGTTVSPSSQKLGRAISATEILMGDLA